MLGGKSGPPVGWAAAQAAPRHVTIATRRPWLAGSNQMSVSVSPLWKLHRVAAWAVHAAPRCQFDGICMVQPAGRMEARETRPGPLVPDGIATGCLADTQPVRIARDRA